jgi:hypothetical protein
MIAIIYAAVSMFIGIMSVQIRAPMAREVERKLVVV